MYYAVAGVVGIVVLAGLYDAFLNRAPNCRDGVQNQDERGIDCGGVCSLVCKEDTRDPVVLWSRSFNTSPGRYTAAAYIQHSNSGAGARKVGYTFQLFDAQNVLVTERQGTIDLPPTRTVPIVETDIQTGSREVARTLFAFNETPVWQAVRNAPPVLRVTNQKLESNASRLTATLVNDSRTDASRAAVTAVLFDAEGVARAASKSIVSVPGRGEEFIVFTWNPAPQGIVRGEIVVLPPF